MIKNWSQIDINQKTERDLKYIKNDIICKHLKEDKYIKFSKTLNAITVIELTREQYEKYWSTQYNFYPEKKEQIFTAIEEKFTNGLTSIEEMLNLLETSKDVLSEKKKAIKYLKGE